MANLLVVYDPAVITVWLLEWIVAIGLSRFARWQSRRGAETEWSCGVEWSRWALLPHYEAALCSKKAGFVIQWIALSVLPGVDQDNNYVVVVDWPAITSCDTFSFGLLLQWIGCQAEQWSYLFVFITLAARSAGMKTLKLAVGSTAVVILVTSFIWWGEWSGILMWEEHCEQAYSHCRCRFPVAWGPSWLSTALPWWFGGLAGSTKGWVSIWAWEFFAVLLASVVIVILDITKVWRPRCLKLLLTALCRWLVETGVNVAAIMYFREWAGFCPLILLNVIFAPLMYWVMLEDSRYWTGLSRMVSSPRLSAVSWRNLQGVEVLKDRWVSKVAHEMQTAQAASRSRSGDSLPRASHIHWTVINLETKVGSGANGTVWKAQVNGASRAVKQMKCDVLDEASIRNACSEVQTSNLLEQGCSSIVKSYGYSVSPPMVQTVMQFCELGSLRDVLDKNGTADELDYVHRLELAADAAAAVAHLHHLGFVHRDIKSLNVMVSRHFTMEEDQTSSVAGRSGSIWAFLGDFGETVSMEESLMETPRQHGTLAFSAPEIFLNWKVQARKQSEEGEPIKGTSYMPEADCYSLSIVLWECCTQLQPFIDVLHPVKGKPLMMIDQYQLGDLIAEEGLRPPLQLASPRMKLALENGWHSDSAQRLTAAQIKKVITDEILMADSGADDGTLGTFSVISV